VSRAPPKTATSKVVAMPRHSWFDSADSNTTRLAVATQSSSACRIPRGAVGPSSRVWRRQCSTVSLASWLATSPAL